MSRSHVICALLRCAGKTFSVSVYFALRAGAPRREFLHWQVSIKTVIWHKTVLTLQGYTIEKHKSNKKNTSSTITITQQECRQICTFDSPQAASELNSTVAGEGELFHTFTILFAKEFVLALLVYCDLYNLYAWPLVLTLLLHWKESEDFACIKLHLHFAPHMILLNHYFIRQHQIKMQARFLVFCWRRAAARSVRVNSTYCSNCYNVQIRSISVS